MTQAIEIKSLDDVRQYHSSKEKRWEDVLNYLERTLTTARDSREVPIYLTKGRIKQPDSAYLKFKRKSRNDPTQITDWIGFRVLCLFEQDVHATFGFLLDLLLNLRPNGPSSPITHFGLKEISIFNWPSERAELLMLQIGRKLSIDPTKTEKAVKDGSDIAYTYTNANGKPFVISFEVRKVARESRYQSVHFVVDAFVGAEPVSCEIQLRTLLQDVWGELEHALSYKKGKIHPHISKSFQLLARELEAKDILVGQLREIRDQENALVRYASTSSGPSRWLNYPEAFLKNLAPATAIKLEEYAKHCRSRKRGTDSSLLLEHSSELLNEIEKLLDDKDPNARYFLSMERAYLDFCSGNLKKAETQYAEIIATDLGRNQWFPYFRCGEARLAQDKIGDALVAFDQCEERMQADDEFSADRYHAKVGLAFSYWSLGKEFLPTCIKKMEEARDLIEGYFHRCEASGKCIEDEGTLRFSLANNLCFYYLESWLSTPDDEKVREIHKRKHLVDERYKQLEGLVESFPESVSSNVRDTMAWYCYQVSEREKSDVRRKDWLLRARQHIQHGEYLTNRAPSRMISNSIQREHMQLILSKYVEEREENEGA